MNLEADRESRQTRETKLNDFQKIVPDKGNIRMDVFVSRMSHQLPKCIP